MLEDYERHYCPECGQLMTFYWTEKGCRLVCLNGLCRRVYDRTLKVFLGIMRETNEIYAR